MRASRSKVANVLAGKLVNTKNPKKVIRETAAYLIKEHRTREVYSLLRDVRSDLEKYGIINVTAVSAFKLSLQVLVDIKYVIKKIYPNAKKIIIDEQIDKEVVSGVRIELANSQLDLTVKSKIDKLKQLTNQEEY